MMRLVKDADRLPVEDETASKLSPKTRLARLEKALESEDPLPVIRELIPDDGTNEQSVVVYAFPCILETGSGGLSILLDRFDDDELARITSSLKSIGANRTLADLQQLRAALQQGVAAGQDRIDAAELVARESGKGIDQQADAHVREMEEKLLEFCRGHLEELAGLK
jgi:hypothetical protein